MTHRTLANADAVSGAAREGLDARSISGFSNLLGQPGPRQRSNLGNDPVAARAVLAALANGMPIAPSTEAPSPSPHPIWGTATLKAGVHVDDNPFIPAGYTYLLQLVSHDLIQMSVPFWAAADAGIGSRNLRGAGLQLDTLYGGGPIACPVAFEPAGRSTSERSLLRLGRVAGVSASAYDGVSEGAGGVCPFRDVARVNVMNGLGTPGDARDSVNFSNAHHTYIADARNDDTVLMTQLTVLMSMAHNAIAAQVDTMSSEAAFGHARNAMLLMYYNIITDDLLKHVLHPHIYRRQRNRSASDKDWLWKDADIPLEFSHGAFRAGHAMVRGHYKMNDRVPGKLDIVTIVDGNHSSGDAFHPLPPGWVLQWSHFFDLGQTPNFSRRIGPTKSRLDHEGLFPNGGLTGPDGITFRDALSAAIARPWKVDALIEEIDKRSPDLIPHDWAFGDRAPRRAAIKDWLQQVIGTGPDSASQIATLTEDLPLPSFVLLEAARDPDVRGRSLGVLGSIIVGEVIGRRAAEGKEQLKPMLDATRDALPTDLWRAIRNVDSMPDLVRFVATHGGLAKCTEMPFI